MDLALRPMSTAQVLDRTFQLYRRNFVLFAGIAALPPALKLGIDLLTLLLGSSNKTGLAAASGLGIVLLAIAYLCGAVLASAASTYAVSLVHLEKRATIGGCYTTIRPYFWTLVGIAFLIGLMMAAIGIIVAIPLGLSFAGGSSLFSAGFGILGILLAIVAVFAIVHLYARFSLATAACVVEKLSATESIGRSRALTKGESGRIWLVLILMLIITYALTLVLMIPGGLISAMGAKTGGGAMVGTVVLSLGEFLASTLAAPILTISLVLIYYDLRVRKEAFDLQLMMESVGVAQPGQAQAQAAGGSAPSIG